MKQFKSQSGRSMVEMLGVLAIVGVLSIGGIMGYSYGMDKYRANETVNDITLRSVDLLNQISMGNVPSLTAWEKETTIYPISIVRNNQLGKYAIVVEDVPSRICRLIGDSLKGRGEVYIGSEISETEFNMTNDPCNGSEKNTIEFYFDPEFVKCTQDSDCGEGYYCATDTGWCFAEGRPIKDPIKECETDTDCGECGGACGTNGRCAGGWSNIGKSCTIKEPNDGICQWNECLPKGCNDTDRPCTGKGVYCANPNTYVDNGCKTFYEGELGTCVQADFKGFKFQEKTYAISNTRMTWWDADAACKSLGYNGLIDVNDLVVGWTGKGDSESRPLTGFGNVIFNEMGRAIWTSGIFDTCRSYVVDLGSGNPYVYNRNRKDLSAYAVCK